MIPFADPAAQLRAHRAEIDRAIAAVLDGGRYILGENVAAFEREFAAFLGGGEAIGVANGTEALVLALRGLGLGPGDEVVTVSHTAVATVAAIELAGATPVLVDIEAGFDAIDPAGLEAAITPRTRAVVAVHLYGQAADLSSILDITRRRGLRLIEDCAQATGARWRGQRLGTLGDAGCFSFYPTKNLGALGDGGAVVARDPAVAARVRALREYGWDAGRQSRVPGMNSRLDELQAAILRVKLPHLDADNARRAAHAARYAQALAGLGIDLPGARGDADHVYHLYVVGSDRRDALVAQLQRAGVGAAVHYPVPVHLQPAYQGRVRCGAMTRTERRAGRILSLPMFPELDETALARVVQAVHEACGR